MKVSRPMMAVPAANLPVGPEWTYEVKWDGYRTLAVKDGKRATLISRNLKNVTEQYPAVAAAVTSLSAGSALLDGEIVALDESGRPSFQALQHRATTKMRVVFYAFDVLHVNGRDLMSQPLARRRVHLTDAVGGSSVLISEPLPGTPKQIEMAVRKLGLEGVVAKRRDSRYEPGKRSGAWVKVKFAKRQEFVVGGFKPGDLNFDSILVGYYDDHKTLCYAGKVRAGFTAHTRAELFEGLTPLRVARCPFVNLPNSHGRTSHWGEGITAEEMTELRWVRPKLVVEVAFTEWTRDGNLRHAAFVGRRTDKSASDVTRET
jgi:bifunctional non-homologous end joining protein LigD